MLAAHGIDVTSVEVNPALVDVVRDGLGFRGPVLVGDGRAVWRRLRPAYDLAILDAFQGETLPGHLLTQEALRGSRHASPPAASSACSSSGAPTIA